MKIQLLRLVVPLIIATCFLNLSCKKDSGFLADYSGNDPYYKDIEFEDEWVIDLTWLEFSPWQFYDPTLKFANENLLISYDHLQGIFAIVVQTGEIAWHTVLEGSDEIAHDSELLIIDNLLVFYDRQGITTVDLLTGQFLNRISYSEIGSIRGSTKAFISHDSHILLMTMQGPQSLGIQRLYKIDPSAMEAALLAEVETSVNYTGMGYIFVDDENNKAFFQHGKTNNFDLILMLTEVSLDDNSIINHELGMIENLGYWTIPKPFSVFNNLALLPFQHTSDLVAYDLGLETSTGTIGAISHIRTYGTHLLSLRPRLALINKETFQNEWKVQYSLPADIDDYDIVDDNQILVVMTGTTLHLIDLVDGQLLVKHSIIPDRTAYFTSNTIVSRKDNLIIKAGFHDVNKHGFIQCFHSPISL